MPQKWAVLALKRPFSKPYLNWTGSVFRLLISAANAAKKALRSSQDERKKQNQTPEDPRIEKIQSRETILKTSSFQYGMKISIENEIFIPGPSLAAEKQDLGLKFSIENEIFKPRMKISSENENFVRGGMGFFFMRSSENEFFRSPGPLGLQWPQRRGFCDLGRLGCNSLGHLQNRETPKSTENRRKIGIK